MKTTEAERNQSALGRWILICLLGQVYAYVVMLLSLPSTVALFKGGLWRSREEVPLAAVVVVLKVVARLLQIWGPIIGVWLTVERSPRAPLFWQIYFFALATHAAIDILALRLVVEQLQFTEFHHHIGIPFWERVVKSQVWKIVFTLPWAFYWRYSRHVRSIFSTSSPLAVDQGWRRDLILATVVLVPLVGLGGYFSMNQRQQEVAGPSQKVAADCPHERATYACLVIEGDKRIPGGKTEILTEDDGVFHLLKDQISRGVTVRFRGDESWFASFAAGEDEELGLGIYLNAIRASSRPKKEPGSSARPWLSIVNQNSCTQPGGAFEVVEMTRGEKGAPESLNVAFEYTCRGSQKRIRGRFCVNCKGFGESAIVRKYPRPLARRQPRVGPHPLAGVPVVVTVRPDILSEACVSQSASFLCVVSQEGEPMESSITMITSDEEEFRPRPGSEIEILIRGRDSSIELKAPAGEFLVPGRYTGVDRSSEAESPGFRLRLKGLRSSSSSFVGQFVVAEIRFAPDGRLERLAASFEMKLPKNKTILGRICYQCSADIWRLGRVAAPALPPYQSSRTGPYLWTSPGGRMSLADIEDACQNKAANYWCLMQSAACDPTRQYLTEEIGTFRLLNQPGKQIMVMFESELSHLRRHTVSFRAPVDQVLEPGLYEGARRMPPPRRPGLDLGGTSGVEFEVTEVALDDEGQVVQLGANYRGRCSRGEIFGRVCIGCRN